MTDFVYTLRSCHDNQPRLAVNDRGVAEELAERLAKAEADFYDDRIENRQYSISEEITVMDTYDDLPRQWREGMMLFRYEWRKDGYRRDGVEYSALWLTQHDDVLIYDNGALVVAWAWSYAHFMSIIKSLIETGEAQC